MVKQRVAVFHDDPALQYAMLGLFLEDSFALRGVAGLKKGTGRIAGRRAARRATSILPKPIPLIPEIGPTPGAKGAKYSVVVNFMMLFLRMESWGDRTDCKGKWDIHVNPCRSLSSRKQSPAPKI